MPPQSTKKRIRAHKNEAEDDNAEGATLQPIAARVLMKVLYGARMARPDLLRAVGSLACRITKWTPRCDRELYRLM